MAVLLTAIGAALAAAIYVLQLRRGRLTLELSLAEEPYSNTTARDVHITVRNASSRPLTLESAFIVLAAGRPMRPIGLKSMLGLPAKLLPGEDSDGLGIDGYTIARVLQEEGHKGTVVVRLGVYDDLGNAYRSSTLRVPTDDWIDGAGPARIYWV